MLPEMRGVYWTVEWLSASQELCFMELLKAYRQWLQCFHLSSCFFYFIFFCANPTGCNIVLFKRGKWLISILFSSLCCKLWRYPQYIGSAWILFACFGKPAWRKNLPQCRSPLSVILIAFVIILLSGRKWRPSSSFLGSPVFMWHNTRQQNYRAIFSCNVMWCNLFLF